MHVISLKNLLKGLGLLTIVLTFGAVATGCKTTTATSQNDLDKPSGAAILKQSPPRTTDGSTPWTTFLFDFGRNNYTPDKMTIPPGGSKKFNLTGSFSVSRMNSPRQYSTPAIVGNTAYVGSSEGAFYALDLISGEEIWRVETNAAIDASPTVTEALVCFGTSGGSLYCLDRSTGKERLRYNVHTEIISSPIISGGSAFFTSADNRLHAIDIRTGEKLWSYSSRANAMVTRRFFNSPAASKDLIYCLFPDGRLMAFSKDNGRLTWIQELLESESETPNVRRTPLFHNGLVYAIDDKGSLRAMDGATGKLKIVYDVTDAVDFFIANGNVIIVGTEEVVSIDKKTGKTLWAKPQKLGTTKSIAGAGENLILLSNREIQPFKSVDSLDKIKSSSGYIQAFSLSTGKLAWSEKLSSTVSGNVSASKDKLSFVTDKGALLIYSSTKD